MPKVLIIAESTAVALDIEDEFSFYDYQAYVIDIEKLFEFESWALEGYEHILLVINQNTKKRFKNQLHHVIPILQKLSARAPVYLLFENAEDADFESWYDQIQAFYCCMTKKQDRGKAIKEILLNKLRFGNYG